MPVSGGAISIVDSDIVCGTSFAVGSNEIFFSMSGSVSAVPISGGPHTVVAPVAASSLITDDTHVYFIANGAIQRIPQQHGPATTPTTITTDIDTIFHIIVDSTNVYWWTMTSTGTAIRKALKTGGAAETLVSDAGIAGGCGSYKPGFASDGSHVYWIATTPSQVFVVERVPISGGAPETVLSAGNSSQMFLNLGLDDSHVYYSEDVAGGGWRFMRASKGNWQPVAISAPLVETEHRASTFVDDTHVYWLGPGSGPDPAHFWRIPKSP